METPESVTSTSKPTAPSKPSTFSWLWPVITNEKEAKKASKSGAFAAAFIAALTCLISLIALAVKEPVLGLDGWGLIDGVLFSVIAWRTFRFSFPWAIVGLLLYFVETCWRWSKVGMPKGIGIVTTAIIFLALIAGVRGTAFLNRGDHGNHV